MALISRVLRNGTCDAYDFVTFWCPGCKGAHTIPVSNKDGQPRDTWQWNGDAERPVFTPSVHCKTGHYCERHPAHGNPSECGDCRESREDGHESLCSVCHSFVGCNGAEPGQIVFLSDSTHHLAGKTVPLPDWPIKNWSDGGSE
jgi:hypothetical protein